MKRPAVFFDRDNTLIACDEYLGDPSKVCLVEGAADAVARARELGYATVIISNQSGVARGYFSEEAVHAVNARLDEMLADANPRAVIDRHEFCPFHPDASIDKYRKESELRKPGPGMILRAAEALALDLSRSWVIGDAPRDIEAGHAAGCRTILFTDSSLKASPAALTEKKIEPDYVCTTLAEAMEFIARNTPASSQDNEDDAPSPPAETGDGGDEEMTTPRGATTPATSPDEPSKPAQPRPLTSIEKLRLKGQYQAGDIDLSAGEHSRSIPPAPEEKGAENEEPATPAAASQSSAPAPPTAKIESIALDILHELRRRHEQPQQDFSVSKLLAGIVQVCVLAALFLAFLNRSAPSLNSLLLFALTLQAMTIALLIMGRQR